LIDASVSNIYVIDDACPEKTGQYVIDNCKDSRVRVIFHEVNKGVGGAVMTGYIAALDSDSDIIVKIDGDGQMSPKLLRYFVLPIEMGECDYTKGNRFYNLEDVNKMPKIRLLGNAVLSFMSKFSTGYWNIFDPTNGYTAIHAKLLKKLPLEKISQRYFFETDMLFRLNTLRAVVLDIPMTAVYGDENSSLKINKILFEFSKKHFINFHKRIFYNYYLREVSIASLELPLGIILFFSGATIGVLKWIDAVNTGIATPLGTVMLTTLAVILGVQFILAFLNYDTNNIPKKCMHKFMT
jgi:glycosyltransferase involved in cell wall biosynthesis